MTLIDINIKSEAAARAWMNAHIISEHWEFSNHHHKVSFAENKDQFYYVIQPAKDDPTSYDGYVHCNYCGQMFQFRDRRDSTE